MFKEQEENLSSRFPGAEYVYIRSGDRIQDIARSKATEFTHIVACGGDGTVSQAANGLIGTGAIMGVIPMGSGNDFAQNTGHKGAFSDHIEALERNKTTQIDLIQADWGYFINSFGLGVDGLTNYYSALSGLKSGPARYFWSALKALILAKPFEATLKLDETNQEFTEKVWMIAVANGKTEGGKYIISPNSVNDDGLVEVIAVKHISRIRLLYEFIKLSLGKPFYSQVVQQFTTNNSFSIHTQKVYKAHADGEQVSGPSQFHFDVIKSGLKVVTGAHKAK